MQRSLVVISALFVLSAVSGCATPSDDDEPWRAYYPWTETSDAPIDLPPEVSEEPAEAPTSAPPVATPAPEPPPAERRRPENSYLTRYEGTLAGDNSYLGAFSRDAVIELAFDSSGWTQIFAEHTNEEGWVMAQAELQLSEEKLLAGGDGIWIFRPLDLGGDFPVAERIDPYGNAEEIYPLMGLLCAGPNRGDVPYDESPQEVELEIETKEDGAVVMEVRLFGRNGASSATFEL